MCTCAPKAVFLSWPYRLSAYTYQPKPTRKLELWVKAHILTLLSISCPLAWAQGQSLYSQRRHKLVGL